MKTILARISYDLYNELKREKKDMNLKEKKKRSQRKKQITFYHASQSIVRKLRKC